MKWMANVLQTYKLREKSRWNWFDKKKKEKKKADRSRELPRNFVTFVTWNPKIDGLKYSWITLNKSRREFAISNPESAYSSKSSSGVKSEFYGYSRSIVCRKVTDCVTAFEICSTDYVELRGILSSWNGEDKGSRFRAHWSPCSRSIPVTGP